MKKAAFVFVALIGFVLSSSAAFAAEGDVPRTASGKPDFSGNYDISSITPFQRPEALGDRLFLSQEEAQSMKEKSAAARAAGAQASDPERAPPKKGGNVGAYNDFWFEWGSEGFAIDGKVRTSVLTDPPNGRMPTLTEAGAARLAAEPKFAWPNKGYAWWLESGETPYDGPEDNVLGVRCLYQPTASVAIRSLPYNNLKTIVQTDTHLMLFIEWMHWARVVRIDSEHLPSEIRSLGGDSIGWWEDDTLVVETTNFLSAPNIPREGYSVTERFSPINEGGLLYSFTVVDPDYEEPYSGELPWPKTEQRAYEYACHEGNYAMGNLLRGARMLEKEYVEKQGSSGDE